MSHFVIHLCTLSSQLSFTVSLYKIRPGDGRCEAPRLVDCRNLGDFRTSLSHRRQFWYSSHVVEYGLHDGVDHVCPMARLYWAHGRSGFGRGMVFTQGAECDLQAPMPSVR